MREFNDSFSDSATRIMISTRHSYPQGTEGAVEKVELIVEEDERGFSILILAAHLLNPTLLVCI